MEYVREFVGLDAFLAVCGVLAAVLSACAYVPYIADTITGRTRPQRASWLIWSVLGSIAVASQIAEGASSPLWFAVVQVGATIVIFALSTRRGSGTYLTRSDGVVLAIAGLGLILWWVTDRAAYALAITISISLIGGLPTALKAYKDPETETLSTWLLSMVASLFALLAVGSFDLVLLAYPLYVLTLYAVFVSAIYLGRSTVSTTDLPPAAPVRTVSVRRERVGSTRR